MLSFADFASPTYDKTAEYSEDVLNRQDAETPGWGEVEKRIWDSERKIAVWKHCASIPAILFVAGFSLAPRRLLRGNDKNMGRCANRNREATKRIVIPAQAGIQKRGCRFKVLSTQQVMSVDSREMGNQKSSVFSHPEYSAKPRSDSLRALHDFACCF